MAGKKRITVRELAHKSYKDIDETLILLWDFGIENVLDPSDSVTGSNIKIAYRALGIPTRREFTSKTFWQAMLKLSGVMVSGSSLRLKSKLSVSSLYSISLILQISVFVESTEEHEKARIPTINNVIDLSTSTPKKYD